MSDENEQLESLLDRMHEQALPVQQGGFQVEAIPTGITTFDRSTGVGGIPRRRVSVFQGEEASGKTLLLLVLIASIQKSGGRAAFVDLEHALTPAFAELLDVDYDNLVISRPRTLEQSYDVAKELGRSGLFDVVGFDSAVALATVDDLERDADEGTKRAGQAQVHSEELKKMVSLLHERTAFVIINQLREDPNPPPWWTANTPRLYSPGGRALRHYSSLVVDIKSRKNYKNADGRRIGHRVHTRVSKNKVAQPWHESEFDLMYEHGIDLIMELVSTGVETGVIRRSGSWYYLDTIHPETGEIIKEEKWLGKDDLVEAIREDDERQETLRQQIGDEGATIAQDWQTQEQEGGWGEVDD